MIAQEQYENVNLAGNYNVGPDDSDCWTTGDLVTLFCDKWNNAIENKTGFCKAVWESVCEEGPHEANFLKLDCSKIKSTFNWKPKWDLEMTIEKIVEWSMEYFNSKNVSIIMNKQIQEFIN